MAFGRSDWESRSKSVVKRHDTLPIRRKSAVETYRRSILFLSGLHGMVYAGVVFARQRSPRKYRYHIRNSIAGQVMLG